MDSADGQASAILSGVINLVDYRVKEEPLERIDSNAEVSDGTSCSDVEPTLRHSSEVIDYRIKKELSEGLHSNTGFSDLSHVEDCTYIVPDQLTSQAIWISDESVVKQEPIKDTGMSCVNLVECNYIVPDLQASPDKLISAVKQEPIQDDFSEEIQGSSVESKYVSKPSKCNESNTVFILKSLLLRHPRTQMVEKSYTSTQSPERPYKCDLCEKWFKTKKVLGEHIRMHSNKRPYKCNLCDSSFKTKKYLSMHSITHSAEKPYKCDLCGSSFKTKNSLRKHIPTHNAEKPYKCMHCDKSFTRKTNLLAHTGTHSAEKPFKCQLCNKTFKLKSSLRSHIRRRTKRCPKSFNVNSHAVTRTCTPLQVRSLQSKL